MNRLTFWRLLSASSLILVGCAEGTILDEDDSGLTSDDDTGKLDSGSGPDAAVTPSRDGSTAPDGASQETRPDAATAPDAEVVGTPDAGTPDAATPPTPDAGRDAAVQDAGAPDTGPPPLVCSNGQTTCGTTCVTTATDAKNCGGCGNVCGTGQSCQNSQCVSPEPQFNVPSGCSKKIYGDHGYAFCTSASTWSDARSACLGAGLDLAIVTDQGENDFVRGNGNSWIAVNDQGDEGSYRQVPPGNAGSVSGAPLNNYHPWKNNEPSNTVVCNGFPLFIPPYCTGPRTDEDCTQLASDGGWSTEKCDSREGFVCETWKLE